MIKHILPIDVGANCKTAVSISFSKSRRVLNFTFFFFAKFQKTTKYKILNTNNEINFNQCIAKVGLKHERYCLLFFFENLVLSAVVIYLFVFPSSS
jgi:hypothetical protein